VVLPAQVEQPHGNADFLGIERRGFEKLVADPITPRRVDHPIIEPVDDQRALVRGGKNKGDFALGSGHRNILGDAAIPPKCGAAMPQSGSGNLSAMVNYRRVSRRQSIHQRRQPYAPVLRYPLRRGIRL
jgi:hypothetical protein